MCGRFALKATTKDIEKLHSGLISNIELSESLNITPSQNIAIITKDEHKVLDFAKWGLVPSWSKDITISHKLFNARCETIDEKVSFRNSFKGKRCLIPATAFYEWKQSTNINSKQAYQFRMNDNSIFFFAGLWDVWKDQHSNPLISATIITTTANSLISKIHNRMPVILSSYNQELWIDSNSDSILLKSMLSPISEEMMTIEEVDKSIFNDNLNNDSTLSLF